jgi:DNA-binding NarL/FixJ family response regulator
VKSYFKDHAEISLVANVGNFLMIRDILQTKDIDVLILDLELEGLSSIFEVKSILKNFPKKLYSVVFQNRFMRQMLLKQVFQDLFTKQKNWKP